MTRQHRRINEGLIRRQSTIVAEDDEEGEEGDGEDVTDGDGERLRGGGGRKGGGGSGVAGAGAGAGVTPSSVPVERGGEEDDDE